jgi:Staphylococcal nuclease homologue
MEQIATGRRMSVRTDPTQDTYDRYGRLLAYLDTDGTDLGEAVLREGWAEVYVYDRPFRRLAAYRQAAAAARAANRHSQMGARRRSLRQCRRRRPRSGLTKTAALSPPGRRRRSTCYPATRMASTQMATASAATRCPSRWPPRRCICWMTIACAVVLAIPATAGAWTPSYEEGADARRFARTFWAGAHKPQS